MGAVMQKRMAVLLAVAGVAILEGSAHAATWVGGTSNAFEDNANWSAALGNNVAAAFVGAPNSTNFSFYQPVVGVDKAIGGISFDTAGWTVADGGGRLLLGTTSASSGVTFNATGSASGTVTIGATVRQEITNSTSVTWNITAGNTLAMNGAVLKATSGGSKLAKTGDGTLQLGGGTANTFGDLLPSAGTVQLAKTAGVDALGGKLITSGSALVQYMASDQVPNAQVYRLSGSATVDLNSFSETVAAAQFSTADNTNALGGGGTVNLRGGTLTLSGATGVAINTLAGAATTETTALISDNGIGTSALQLGGTVSFNVADGDAAIDLDVATRITSSSAGYNLTKTGAGVARFGGSNTYGGTTTVSGGTLLINGLTSNQGNVTVAAGAVLGGHGAIGLAASKAVSVSGILAPGDDGASTADFTLGTLGNNDSVTFNSGSSLAIDLLGSGADRLVANGNLTLGSNVALSLMGTGSGTYTIARYTGSLSGTFATIPDGVSINYGDGSDDVITVTVPEPTHAVVLGLAMAGLVRRRRVR